MYSLFIDTHFKDVVIVLYKNGIVFDKCESSNEKHSVVTMPMIVDILSRNSITIDDIKEIICVNGPGSFTGVRIGVTIAKVMAFAKNINLKVIDYLNLMSYFDQRNNKYVAIVDKNGAFLGEFDNNCKKVKEYVYLNKIEYVKYKEKYNVVENINIDYNYLFSYFLDLPVVSVHLANPIYVKNVEVQK